MCGRFTRIHPWHDIWEMYRIVNSDPGRNTEARYNIAPTQTVDFVTADGSGNHQLHEGRWGLVPHWAKEIIKASTINARIETADTTAMFRDAWRSRRCLVPADGFYEWTVSEVDGKKDPWFIHLPERQPFSFAGLWAKNDMLGIESCTIITAAAAEPMRQLHDRQPVILDPAAYDAWLDPATATESLKPLLQRDLDGRLRFYRVDRAVNTYKTQGGRCIEPVNPS